MRLSAVGPKEIHVVFVLVIQFFQDLEVDVAGLSRTRRDGKDQRPPVNLLRHAHWVEVLIDAVEQRCSLLTMCRRKWPHNNENNKKRRQSHPLFDHKAPPGQSNQCFSFAISVLTR